MIRDKLSEILLDLLIKTGCGAAFVFYKPADSDSFNFIGFESTDKTIVYKYETELNKSYNTSFISSEDGFYYDSPMKNPFTFRVNKQNLIIKNTPVLL